MLTGPRNDLSTLSPPISSKESSVEDDGDADPWWGSEAMRERQTFLGEVDNWDHDALASSDFGLLWG